MILVTMSFGAPRNLCHGPKEAAGALRRANVGEACRNLTVEGKGLESREGFVPKAVVPTHQFSLVVGSGEGIFILLGERRRWVKHQFCTMDGIGVSLVGRRREVAGNDSVVVGSNDSLISCRRLLIIDVFLHHEFLRWRRRAAVKPTAAWQLKHVLP
jgi:hypothetical protein